MIELHEIKRSYNNVLVLNIEKLEINRGLITGIIGSNGAGKTTLLRILAGLDIDFKGRVISDKGVDKTMVFQKPILFKETVRENIEYPLKLRNMAKDKIEKRVSELIEQFEINSLETKRGNELSGGEMQKVALARALSFNPSLLLLDEPTSSLDPDTVLLMERIIKEYCLKTKATVVVITHNLEQAKRLCDECIELELGRVVNGIF